MVLELIIDNDNFTTFKLGNDYIVIEYTHQDKVKNFQNGLIAKALLTWVKYETSWAEIDKIISEIRKSKVHFI